MLPEPCSVADFSGKDLDLVVFGSTGFTGKLASKYLAKEARLSGVKWAIAGRHRDELESLKANLSLVGPNAPAIVVADLEDPKSLQEMTARAKAIMTYAGPYRKYGGEALLQAAISTCTHYADLCGEADFKTDMLNKYDAAAKNRGIVIMQALGMDSMPADLLAMASAQRLAEDSKGGPTDVTIFFSKLNGLVSGATIAAGLDAEAHKIASTPQEEAYALAPQVPVALRANSVAGGELPRSATRSSEEGMSGYDPDFSSAIIPYIMAYIDAPTVRRSLAMTYPNDAIFFSEVMGSSVSAELSKFLLDPQAIKDPPKMNLAPGEGPPEWTLEKGSLGAQGLAKRTGDSAKEARVFMDCHNDPGYGGTAKWSIELALLLSSRVVRGGSGGYLTPTLALGVDAMMKTLSEADGGTLCTFKFE